MEITLNQIFFATAPQAKIKCGIKESVSRRVLNLLEVTHYNAKRTSRELALALTFSLITGPARTASSTWLQNQTQNMHQIQGPFISRDFGFSISPPPGVAEYVTNGGDANHGPTLILGDERKIVVYPAYTGFVSGDDKPCRANQFAWESSSKKTISTGKIGNRNACMVTFIQGNVVWRVAQTTGRDRSTGIIYTVLLTTTRQWARMDFRSFRRVADSFKRVPIIP